MASFEAGNAAAACMTAAISKGPGVFEFACGCVVKITRNDVKWSMVTERICAVAFDVLSAAKEAESEEARDAAHELLSRHIHCGLTE